MEHSDSRGKTVGGAGGTGHALHGRVVGVLTRALTVVYTTVYFNSEEQVAPWIGK